MDEIEKAQPALGAHVLIQYGGKRQGHSGFSYGVSSVATDKGMDLDSGVEYWQGVHTATKD